VETGPVTTPATTSSAAGTVPQPVASPCSKVDDLVYFRSGNPCFFNHLNNTNPSTYSHLNRHSQYNKPHSETITNQKRNRSNKLGSPTRPTDNRIIRGRHRSYRRYRRSSLYRCHRHSWPRLLQITRTKTKWIAESSARTGY
jgi:hypothetical protein